MQTTGFTDESEVVVQGPLKEAPDEPLFWIGVGQGGGESFREAWWPGYARIGASIGERCFILPESTTRDSVPLASTCPLCGDPTCWGVVLTDIALFNNDGKMVNGARMAMAHFLKPGNVFRIGLVRL